MVLLLNNNTLCFQKLSSQLIWQINLGGNGNVHQITNIATKNSIEHVHSQGRVFNDRSVLYKYINPNLVVVATQGPDSIHKRKCFVATLFT